MFAGNRPYSKGGMNNAEKFCHGVPGKQSTNCFTKRKMTAYGGFALPHEKGNGDHAFHQQP
jgi:hypothetical protein